MIRKTAKKFIKRLSSNNYQVLNYIELDRSKVLANLEYVKHQHPEQSIIPVLKANAYGHGLIEMAGILNQTECAFLAVDGYFEAAKIKDISRHPILVLGYIKPENANLLDTKHCSFVVQDSVGLHALGSLNKPVKIHLELETGMNRLGLTTAELDRYLQTLKQYPKLELEGIMTHLADADNPKNYDFTIMQVENFDKDIDQILSAGFRPKFFHIAQTAGSVKVRSRHANAIRLGIGVYGFNPLSPEDKYFNDLAGLQPVLEFKSTIIKTYDLLKGDKVSYNGTFTAPAKMRIGILPLGYYEGVPLELSNKGVVMKDNKSLPIIGKVCMNHTIINIAGTELQVGDVVSVIGNNPTQPNSVQYASQNYGIFSYGWFTSLSSSVRRIIV